MLDHQRCKFVLDAVVHQKARGRNANLARIAKLGAASRLDGQRHIRIITNNNRRMAAKLHGRALHMQAGHRGQLFANRRRAGESHLADDGVRNQIAGYFMRVAKHQANRTGGHTCIHKSLQQRSG